MTGQGSTKSLSNISWPKATAKTINGVGRLLEMIDVLPAVFPTEQHPLVRPLKIGIAADLHCRLSQPVGMTEGAAHAIAADVLRRYTASKEYRTAVAAPGAWRHDLDGNPIEPVSEGHAQFARGVQPRPPIIKKVTVSMQVPAIKVTLPITPDLLPPVDETTKSVELKVDLGDGKPFTVGFSGKNYRRALRQVSELQAAGDEVIIVMQGRLVAGHKIEQAGLAVQAKTPKAEG